MKQKINYPNEDTKIMLSTNDAKNKLNKIIERAKLLGNFSNGIVLNAEKIANSLSFFFFDDCGIKYSFFYDNMFEFEVEKNGIINSYHSLPYSKDERICKKKLYKALIYYLGNPIIGRLSIENNFFASYTITYERLDIPLTYIIKLQNDSPKVINNLNVATLTENAFNSLEEFISKIGIIFNLKKYENIEVNVIKGRKEIFDFNYCQEYDNCYQKIISSDIREVYDCKKSTNKILKLVKKDS